MITGREIEKVRHAPLEEALLKGVPATVLRWLYDVSLRTLAEQHPRELPQFEASKRPRGDKAPNKDYLMQLLIATLRNRTIGLRFFNSLPRPSRDVLTSLTWQRQANLAALEKSLGLEIAQPNPNEREIYYNPFLIPANHGFLLILKGSTDSWQYYTRNEKPKKEEYSAFLPDAIRNAFKTLVPPPEGYELLPLPSLPSGAGTLYSCCPKAISDIWLIAEYMAQGHLKYTMAERVAAHSIKALHQLTGGPEFFDGSPGPDLVLLRTRLITGGMAFAAEKERQKLLARPGSSEPLRDLIENVLAQPCLLHEELLGHLRTGQPDWCSYSPKSLRKLALFFGRLPAEKWVSWENVRSYHLLREEAPTIFDSGVVGLTAAVTAQEQSWSPTIFLSRENEFDLASEPLLKGYAFLLAAFGLLEIAYTLPSHPAYCRPRHHYLSPYDGLRYLRLTPLGEFVFRRRDTYDVAATPRVRSPIVLDHARLLATCRSADTLTELTLGRLFEKLGPDRYRMTPKSLLRGCHNREDIEKRLRLFRRTVSANPPPIWEGFFERTLARIAPLNRESDYIVLKVSADEEIRRLLASDPVLRELVLKVEGLRIAVRQNDLTKVAARLEHFGYLSPVS